MKDFLRKWLSISFFNLLLVAVLGFILRYKIAFYLPFSDQKFILHSHSHFAFTGWLSQTLMVLMIWHLSRKLGDDIINRYRSVLYANLFAAYGMLISFILQGYALFSISFSTLSILVSYQFVRLYWSDLNRIKEKEVSRLWFKAALIFSLISSAGTFCLAYMMSAKIVDQNLYLASVYLFLHFQYNGWFMFSGLGLLSGKLEKLTGERKNQKTIFILFCMACVPGYFLSVLWAPFIDNIYLILVIAVLAQLAGWLMLLKIIFRNKEILSIQLNKYGKILLILSAIAFSIKLILQTGSLHPALSQLSYGFRPIIIGYLHLVLLGVTSIFILGYIISFKLIPVNKLLIRGIFVFVAGVIINELFLMIQGIAALSYTGIPYINEMLLAAAIILFSGTLIMLISRLSTTE
ncbi:hypothetical protein [Daejeonella sp. H1SJ63]|jgi:hypothetical protein|uniref:hypothetical protein n=1 Tax=Daejeonella sp. H1SJ63 TaxID=3034145 RepID=UPI0023EBAA0A|nr:hypothetical protein [Daejeonella sp. H1SJ63]